LRRGTIRHFNLFVGPGYFSWNRGGIHFIVYNGWDGMSKEGRLRQEKWLKADLDRLKPGTAVIVFTHSPVSSDKWRKDIKQIAWFYGHYHENYIFYCNGVPYICTNTFRTGDLGAWTSSYRLCRIKNGLTYS